MSYLVAILLTLVLTVSASAQSTCQGGGVDVKYISTNADWNDINNTTYNVFCVAPGDYTGAGTSGMITITQDGTSGNRKYLLYYNPSNPTDTRHPYHMSAGEQATVRRIFLNNAHYWTIRQLHINVNWVGGSDLQTLSGVYIVGTNNLIEWNLLHRFFRWGFFVSGAGSDFNTIRGNVARDSVISGGDKVAIYLDSLVAGGVQRGTIVEQNEVYDSYQALQICCNPSPGGGRYPGTIIRDNDFYLTSASYYNCSGSPSPTGNCSRSEMMMVLKLGGTSSALADQVTIYGNRIWGSRIPDPVAVGASGWGNAILVYGDSDFVLVQNNITSDNSRQLESATSTTSRISYVDNIVYDTFWNGSGAYGQSTLSQEGSGFEWYRNVIVEDNTHNHWGAFGTTNVDFKCNTIFNSNSFVSGGTGNVIDYNFYYNSSRFASPGTNDIIQGTQAASNNATLTYTRKRITAPELATIPFALTTPTSPHFNQCDPNLGSRTNIGVDDRNWAAEPLWDFTVAHNGNTSIPGPGSSTTRTITATQQSGTAQSVFFWHRGTLPTGVAISFSPHSCVPSAPCQTTALITTTGGTPTGNHTITFSGESGQVVNTTDLTLTVQAGGDTEEPTIAITQPTSSPTYLTASSTVALGGTASDNIGVTSVTWENTTTTDSGTATGTTSWSIASIDLVEGANVIEVTAHDAAGNTGVAQIVVTLVDILFLDEGNIDSISGLSNLTFIVGGNIDSISGLSSLAILDDGVIDSISGLSSLEFIPDGQIDSVSVD